MGASESDNQHPAEPAVESGDSPSGGGQSRPNHRPTAREAAQTFSRELASAVTRRTSRACTTELVGLSAESLADFHASMPPAGARMLLTGRQSQPDRALEVVLEVPQAAAFALIDTLLGGDMGGYVPDRAVNETERRLLCRTAAEAVEALCRRVWCDNSGLISVDSTDAPDQPDRPSEPVVVARTELSLDGAIGILRLAIPRGVLEGSDRKDRPCPDKLVQIAVEASDPNLNPEDLAELAPGDILITDLPADGEVRVRVAGIDKFVGRLAAGNGRRAVHITGRTDQTPD